MASSDDLEFLIGLGLTLDDDSFRKTSERAQQMLGRLFQGGKADKAAEAAGKSISDRLLGAIRKATGAAAGKAGKDAGAKFAQGVTDGARVSEQTVKAMVAGFAEAERRITQDQKAQHLARAAALRETLYRELADIRTFYGQWNTEAKNAQQQRNNESRELQLNTKRDIQTLRTLSDFQKSTAAVAKSANDKQAAASKAAAAASTASAKKVDAGYRTLGELFRSYAKIHKASSDVTISDNRKVAAEATATAKKVGAQFKFMGEGMKAYATTHASETRRIVSNNAAQTAAQNAASRQAIQNSKAAQSAADNASKARLAAEQRDGNMTLQAMKANDREQYTEQQAHQARRTALFRAGVRMTESAARASMSGLGSLFRWGWRRITDDQRQAGREMVNQTNISMTQMNTAIAIGIDQSINVYSRGAARRLTQIQKDADKETKVVTEAQVERAAAVKRIQDQTKTGVIGAATGGTGLLAGAANLRTALAGAGSVVGLGAILKGGFNRLRTIEDATASLTVILGSQKKAADLMADVLKTAQGTPFTLPDFATAAKNLSAANIAAKDIPRILTAIGESAALSGKGTEGLTTTMDAFTDIASQGRLQLDQVNRIAANGIPALQLLANKFGVSRDSMMKMIHDGAVPAEDAIKALTDGILEGSKGVAGNTRSFAGTMQALRKTVSGSAGGMKAALDRFGAALIAPAFKVAPGVLKRITDAIDDLTGFVKNLTEGKGAWKVLRDGLLGVAVGLAAIATAKLGFEVLKLMPAVLSALTANPILVGLGLLGGAIAALVLNVEPVREFFKAFWNGTRGWFLVGYRIGHVYDKLSPIVTIQSSIGAAARKAVDFFKAFVNGTKGWFTVGYRLGEVYDKLTPIVALQSAFGATARVFRDAFQTFVDTVKEKGLSADSIFEGLGDAGEVVKKRMGPIKDAVFVALGEIGKMIGDFFTGFLTDPFKMADVTSSQGIISEMIRKGGTADKTAPQLLGEKLRGVIDKAWGIVLSATGSFLSGLFRADPAGENEAALELGAALRRIIGRVVGGVSNATGSLLSGLFNPDSAGENRTALKLGRTIRGIVKRALEMAGTGIGVIGDLIGKFVVPAIIDIPRVIGRFLSRTAFSEPFIKIVVATAAIVGGLAVTIAFQFVRGFLEGLWQRKGDILSAIFDIFKWVATQFVGGGNPLAGIAAFIGTALVAAFAVIKVGGPIFKAIGELKDNFKIAGVAIRDGIEPAHQKMIDLRKEALQTKVEGKGTGSGIVTAMVGTRRAVDGTVDKVQRGTLVMANGVARVQDATVKLGDGLLTVGQKVAPAFGAIGTEAQKAGLLVKNQLTGAWEEVVPKAQAAADKVKEHVGGMVGGLESGSDKGDKAMKGMAVGIEVSAGLISGYMAGMSDDATSMAASMVGAAGSIATAFATGGPWAGAAAIGATAVGWVLGNMQKKAREAEAERKKIEASAREIGSSLRNSFQEGFKEVGGIGLASRFSVTLSALKTEIGEAGGVGERFAQKFDVSMSEVAAAAAKGTAYFEKFTQKIIDNKVAEIMAGDKQAMKDFAAQSRAAFENVASGMSIYEAASISATDVQERLNDQLGKGKIGVDEWADRMIAAGAAPETVRKMVKGLNTELGKEVRNSPVAQFVAGLPSSLQKAGRAYAEERAAEEAWRQDQIKNLPAADQTNLKFDDLKGRLDSATTAMLNLRTAAGDTSLGFANASTQMLGSIEQIVGNAEEKIPGLGNSFFDQQTKIKLTDDAIRNMAPTITTMVQESGGNVDVLKQKIGFLRDSFEKGLKEKGIDPLQPAVKKFLDEVFKIPTKKEMKVAMSTLENGKQTTLTDSADSLYRIKVNGEGINGALYTYTTKHVEQVVRQVEEQFRDPRTGQLGSWSVNMQSGVESNELKRARDLETLRRVLEKNGKAKGGFITKPEIALIGEAGNELILPLTDPARTEELLKQAGLDKQILARSASVATTVPTGASAAAAGVPAALGASAGPASGASVALTATATTDKAAIDKATTDTAVAFAPIGQKMSDAAAPGLSVLEQTTGDNAKAIQTSYVDSHKTTVESSLTWPTKMRAAAAPGLAVNQALIKQGNQNVRTDYRNTQVATVNSANVMAVGVSAAGRTMSSSVTTSAATMATNLISSATTGSKSAVSVMTTTLRAGATEVARIAHKYSVGLADALNPVLASVNGKKITVPPMKEMARGGFVPGSQTTSVDTVPAMLMTGEYVQPRSVVQHYGTDFMDDLRKRKIPRYAGGGLVYPIAGHSTAGQANSWGNPRSGGRSHKGSDLFAPTGTPVVSATPGIVEKVNRVESGLGGITVTVGNGGWNYYYAHLVSVAAGIVEGLVVKAGQVLGGVGQTGNARGTPPHLHFSIYPDAGGYNAGVNPWPLLTGSTSMDAMGAVGMGPALPPIPGTKPGWIGDTAKAAMKHTEKAIEPWVQQHVNTFGAASATNFPIDPAIFKNINPNAVLATIRMRESGGNYQAQNPTSSASGAYQFLNDSWRRFGGSTARAADASPAEQDRVAMNFLNYIMGRYGPVLEAIPATWYEGHYNGPGSLNHAAADGGSVSAYVQKWIQQYQSILNGSSVRLADGGLVSADAGVRAASTIGPMGTSSSTTNNRSFDGSIVGELHVHSNASDAEAVAMLLGARLDPITRRAMVSA